MFEIRFLYVMLMNTHSCEDWLLEPSKKPLNVLIKHLNGNVSVKLKSDVEYRGKMIQCDNFMNIILDEAVEHQGGTLVANYGYVLIRGNNILYVSVDQPSV